MVNHSYDALNRLISSTVGNAAITYAYNPQGIRTSRTVGATTTQYLLDGGDVVGETTGGTTTTYLRGLNLVSDGTNYYLHNAHGDVAMLANASGTVIKTYEYDAFGNQLNTTTNDTNPFRYCGEYYDSETGNYYLRARYYDPTIGRFTQKDTHWNTANMIYGDSAQTLMPQPLAIRQAGNLYAYCANDPVTYVDYSGNSMTLAKVAFDNSIDPSLLARGAMFGAVIVTSIILAEDIAEKEEISSILLAKGKAKAPKVPSKLRKGDKVKTPDSHPDEFSKNKDGSYTHKDTGWNFKRAGANIQHGGPHWDAKPPRVEGHINVGPDGNIF